MSENMSEKPLIVKNISKTYGSSRVLQEVGLELETGEIFGLIGLNGIGKTTLIKIILGLVRPDSGTVDIFGESWQNVSAKKHLTYLPEKFQPSRHLTGFECIKIATSYYGKTFDKSKAEHEAELLGLDPLALKRKISGYSKGMGQKIGLISALMIDTPLIILDEPMSGLDPKARIQLKDRLKVAKSEGKTIFFSSHILADIEEICDRIAILHDGTFQYYGTTADFVAKYTDISLERAFLKIIEPQNKSVA
jgi:ABC-2 type transport system ATP-binding protein